ncbi:MAG: penicillin-binding protein 2 [Phycisphaerales bacterium]|nr:MAG: penicillin-binding protein 2 [Phycisphaerales bacterium]
MDRQAHTTLLSQRPATRGSSIPRLALILGIFLVLSLVLATQASRLAILHADAAREDTEARLLQNTFIPAARGSILDRKGRILAMDRPGYRVDLPYDVISGEWAKARAASHARSSTGHAWAAMSKEQRAERVLAFEAVYNAHLAHAWDLLAERAGVDRSTLDQARDSIVRQVESRRATLVDFWRIREFAALRDQGVEITDEVREQVEKRTDKEIAEQRSNHTVIRALDDDAAFACLLLVGERVEVLPPGVESRADSTADDSLAAAEPGTTQFVETIPGLTVTNAGEREYPMESVDIELDRSTFPSPLRTATSDATPSLFTVHVDGLLCHVLGKVRSKVYAEDAPARRAYLDAHPDVKDRALAEIGRGRTFDLGQYFDDDRVGDAGIESSREHELRGLRGVKSVRVDATDDSSIRKPTRGRDLHLTIDAMLQARVQAAMTPEAGLAVVQSWQRKEPKPDEKVLIGELPLGTPLCGAAVVLDVDTAEILAMVSTPTYTREQLESGELSTNSRDLALRTPLVNRAIASAYQPGSIVKALILSESESRGVMGVDERIACTGHFLPNDPDSLRCWIYKEYKQTHSDFLGHDLAGDEAIMVSCNIVFFELGKRLGPSSVRDVFRDFHVGTAFNLGIGLEYPGELGPPRPDPTQPGRFLYADGEGISMGQAIQMGIGQGPVAWTPLHAANAYATLARFGARVEPRIVEEDPITDAGRVNLNQSAVEQTLHGLWLSVNDSDGTGNHLTINGSREPIFNAKGVKIWGKTGTATASPLKFSPDGTSTNEETIAAGDHSWFVILVGRDRPRYAIAVVCDYAGSGGKVSGPIANQIVHALIAEGYLEP